MNKGYFMEGGNIRQLKRQYFIRQNIKKNKAYINEILFALPIKQN